MDSSLVVYGTYAADFNNIEYAQRLTHYASELRKNGCPNLHFIMNASPSSVKALTSLLDLDPSINCYSDELGVAGKEFGVNKGWRSDDTEMNAYLKLFGMLFGLGAWKTLPSVIGGYLGNPFAEQPWIESALAQGTVKGRFPTNALEMAENGAVRANKFADLPVVGNWGRRPLELATLRLQNMMGVSLQHWDELKPSEAAMRDGGVLTQLGGCACYDKDGREVYAFRDEGICNVAKFEDIIESMQQQV
jgi:hypothetical protein